MGKKYQNCIAFRTLHKSHYRGKIYEDKLNGNFCNGQNLKNDCKTISTYRYPMKCKNYE